METNPIVKCDNGFQVHERYILGDLVQNFDSFVQSYSIFLVIEFSLIDFHFNY